MDEGFIWTRQGRQMTRQQLLDQLSSRQLKHPPLDISNVTVNIYGETAIVRVSTREFVASRAPGRAGRPGPWKLFYTLIVANKDNAWKPVALYMS